MEVTLMILICDGVSIMHETALSVYLSIKATFAIDICWWFHWKKGFNLFRLLDLAHESARQTDSVQLQNVSLSLSFNSCQDHMQCCPKQALVYV